MNHIPIKKQRENEKNMGFKFNNRCFDCKHLEPLLPLAGKCRIGGFTIHNTLGCSCNQFERDE